MDTRTIPAFDINYHRYVAQHITAGPAPGETVESSHEALLAEVERLTYLVSPAKLKQAAHGVPVEAHNLGPIIAVGVQDDDLPTGWDTPVWASTSHDLSFQAVTGVEMKQRFAVIRTTGGCAGAGPSIQRVSDEEAINRMRLEHLQRTGEDTVFAPHVERHLLRMVAGDRTRVLLDLDEARKELESFEASLQAKKDRVAELERDAVRNDYLLGIRDDLTPAAPGGNR